MSAARVEAEVIKRYDAPASQHRAPSLVLASGIEGNSSITTPNDIVVESVGGDLLTGPAHLAQMRLVGISDLRANPSLIQEVVS